MYKVVLVNTLNPLEGFTVVVSAPRWREAMHSAQSEHPGYIAVEVEAVTESAQVSS